MAIGGTLESAKLGEGFLLVTGWLSVPRHRAWPEVMLAIGGRAQRIDQWFPRPDLPADDPDLVFAAFAEELTLPPEGPAPSRQLRLMLGNGEVVGSIPREGFAPFMPEGYLEVVVQHAIAGWVHDPAIWLADRPCQIALDGEVLGPAPLTIQRPDLPFPASRRGEKLGFWLDSSTLGTMLGGRTPFGSGREQRWALLASGREVAAHSVALEPHSRGRLEAMREGELVGWASIASTPPSGAVVELLLDGTSYATQRADLVREDLMRDGIGPAGFSQALRFSPSAEEPLSVAARVLGEERLLPGSPLLVAGLTAWAGAGAGPWRGLAGGRPRVAVVVPVFNAPEELARCLRSILRNTNGAARLIVVDDASPDPRVAELLAELAAVPGVTLLRNPVNLGFSESCNRGIAEAGQDDVVLANSDIEVPERWLDNLIAAAYAAPRIASVTPMGDHAGAFSFPEPGRANPAPHGLGITALARLAAQQSIGLYPEVPTGHGFCLYLRRSAIEAVGPLDAVGFPRGYGEENDWSMRALRAGLCHVLDDRTYVRHAQGASFGGAKAALLAAGRALVDRRYPEYGPLVQQFAELEPLRAVRWRLRQAFAKVQAAAPRPRVLFVISTESGGTPQTNLDLMLALADRYEPWLLRCDSQRLTLSRLREGGLETVRTLDLPQPLDLARHGSDAYDEAVAALLLHHAIELLHIRHLAWHGLNLPAIARALGIPVVFSFHDFYTACPNVKLLDGAQAHCAGRCTASAEPCQAELWPPAAVPELKHRFVHRWREMMGAALAQCDAFVTTSAQAREVMVDCYPFLGGREFRVIGHGRSFAAMLPPAEAPPGEGTVLRVLVPGIISVAKGAELIAAMAAQDQGQRVEFHILGEAEGLQAAPGLVLHGSYRRDEFTARAAAIGAHMGAVLSIWPETWCHTLTELWASGLPVFGLDLGAVGERIAASGAGWRHPPAAPAKLLAAILAAAADAAGFAARQAAVAAWQAGEGRQRDCAAMAADYAALYEHVIQARRAFPDAPPALPGSAELSLSGTGDLG
jgi:GT2 family glycosyltransferase